MPRVVHTSPQSLAAAALAMACACRSTAHERSEDLLVLAEDAARWIRVSAQPSQDGTRWPANPAEPASVDSSLYGGAPGVVLFLLDLHGATGERSCLEEARAGADALAADLEAIEDPGLYTGLAGAGFTLLETHRVTGEPRHRSAAEACVRRLVAGAHEAGAGLEWNATTDVMAGSAGIGLFLLHAARELGDPAALEAARRAGERLIELARAEPRGLSWAMDPSFPRRMPNFSHGTAGVAYFLARLFEETGEERFLDAARAGAEYLLDVADTRGDAARVFHHEPDGKDLYYLGWCHGPVGTARLFYLLHRITGDESWWTWVRRCANAIERSGTPKQPRPASGTTPAPAAASRAWRSSSSISTARRASPPTSSSAAG